MSTRTRPIPLLMVLAWCSGVAAIAAAAQQPPVQPGQPALPSGPPPLSTEAPPLPAIDPARPTLFLIGDSTMKVGTAGQMGWGEALGPFFDLARINLVNYARGGRSSRTFSPKDSGFARSRRCGRATRC